MKIDRHKQYVYITCMKEVTKRLSQNILFYGNNKQFKFEGSSSRTIYLESEYFLQITLLFRKKWTRKT